MATSQAYGVIDEERLARALQEAFGWREARREAASLAAAYRANGPSEPAPEQWVAGVNLEWRTDVIEALLRDTERVRDKFRAEGNVTRVWDERIDAMRSELARRATEPAGVNLLDPDDTWTVDES